MTRLTVFLGGVAGAAGVVLSAVAAHRGGNFGTAATMLLAHAPALLVIGLHSTAPHHRTLDIAAAAMVAGLVLFCSDLVVRDLGGERLFAMAAPIGGILMIAGWLGVAASALYRN